MKLQIKLLATSLLLASAPAFAAGDDATLITDWDMYNSVWVQGDVFVTGAIDIASESGALVDQDQLTGANLSLGDGDNDAFAADDALSGAQGNIGANIAAGVGNAQANDAAIAATDSDDAFASAMVFSSQATGGNLGTDFPSGPDAQHSFSASVTDNVLSGAAGNIGLNVAAGVGNAQGNALAAAISSDASATAASADTEQFTALNILLATADLDNTAYLGDSALSGAVGNIGVNVAAGMGNAQHNGLSLAVGN